MSRIFNKIKTAQILDLLSIYSIYALGLLFIMVFGIVLLSAVGIAVVMLFTRNWFSGAIILAIIAFLTWVAIRIR